MTRLPRPTLRALRGVVARAYGVRRSRVRVLDREELDASHREILVRLAGRRGERGDWWSVTYHAQPCGRRWAVRYIARRAWAGDLP